MYRVAQIPLGLADDPPEDRFRLEFLSFARTGFRRCDKKCSASIDAYRRGRWPATNSRETHLSEIVRFDPCGSSPSAGEIRSSPRGTEGSNPCTLQSGYWLVDIVDWSGRAGRPGVARESPCSEHLERSSAPAGRPRRKSRG